MLSSVQSSAVPSVQFGERIFVLEDNEKLREGLRTALEKQGHEVCDPLSLADAGVPFYFGKETPFDVFLIDKKLRATQIFLARLIPQLKRGTMRQHGW